MIYETLRCSKCKELYKGIFKQTSSGHIVCAKGCDNKQYLDKTITFKQVNRISETDSRQENTIGMLYQTFIERDIHGIYNTEYHYGEDIFELLFDNGIIDSKFLYFQNNELGIVINYHNVCYKLLSYLDEEKLEDSQIEYIYTVLDMYRYLRLFKLTQKEEEMYKTKLKEIYQFEKRLSLGGLIN